MGSDENPVLEAVKRVLSPLPDGVREEVLALVDEHMAKCPLIAYCCAVGEPSDLETHPPDAEHPSAWTSPVVYEFSIGNPNPLNRANTVFGMFHWHVQGYVVVYSIDTAQLESGDALAVYTRDVVFQPRFLSGPLSLEALAADLGYHLEATPWDDRDDDDEPDTPPPNDKPAERENGTRPRLGARS